MGTCYGRRARKAGDVIPNDVAAGHDGSGDPLLDVTRLTPSAAVTAAQAADAVRVSFRLSGGLEHGLEHGLERLPGEADDNFLLRAGGEKRYVVKFAHLRADPRVVSVQVRVLKHIESVAGGLPVPRVVPAVDGQLWTMVADGPLRGRVVHVITYLDGELLRAVPTSAALRYRLGVTLAELGRALREFDDDDPVLLRPLLWDLSQLAQLSPLIAERPKTADTNRLDEQLNRFTAEVAPRLAAQRTQLVHNDFSPDNVLADARRVRGIIDFGDVTVTALVNDVAIAAAYQLSPEPDLLRPALDLISGYHATTPLTTAELDLLPELIGARILARIVISEWRAARFGDNRAYILRNTPRAWDHLGRLQSIRTDEITERIHRACEPEARHA
jgi:Ser/Thr protein kinase RdoA (MazF antagonist)